MLDYNIIVWSNLGLREDATGVCRIMDAANAVSVTTVGTPLYKTCCTKAKTFRHEGFPGDSSAEY